MALSIKDSKGKLDNLLDSGNVEKAMQMAFAVLSAAEGTSDEQTNSVSSVTIRTIKHYGVISVIGTTTLTMKPL